MINNTVDELSSVIGATPALDDGAPDPQTLSAAVTGVRVDSREVGPGDLFVALPGDRVDGHDFAEAAIAAGAVAAVTARPVPGVPCLLVPDPLAALGGIGRHVTRLAKQHRMQVIGITGSAGKTTSKDLLAQILETDHSIVAPKNSMNNEIGLPLTASRVTADTRYLISEMGAKGIGHIRYLCQLTPPDIGLELGVGVAHIGAFGSQHAIAQAKAELVEELPTDGIAVLNAADPRVAAMADRTSAKVLRFAVADAQVDPARLAVYADRLAPDELDRWGFRLRLGDDVVEVRLQLVGEHQVINAVAAAATAFAIGVDAPTIASVLSRVQLRSRWRMELGERADGMVVINDAYNANPPSMIAALAAASRIARMRRERTGRPTRTTAVLGEMLELGPESMQLHADVGRQLVDQGIDRLITVGAGAEPIGAGAREAGMAAEAVVAVADRAAALGALDAVGPDDLVVIKASRDVGLETVGDQLLAAGGHEPQPGE